ncbi:MAG: NAD(P)-dependent oxidoreductase [Candidatus Lambdaproteobacteria bacterium]|nr:NAD(P)-dependent oxidoreductase [Candidatus Lambdaproteobacteria bacterium]
MKLGFIGVGNMGGPMCRNLIKKDFQVAVYDLNPEAVARCTKLGATTAKSAQEIAAQSDVVFTSLPGPAEIEAVALGKGGILEGAHPGMVYVDLSTDSPSLARRLAAEFDKRGIPMLDAPVSGGVTGAEAGTVSVIVGGPKEVYDQVMPMFQAIGKNVYHMGDHGAGCIAKLVNNMLSFINFSALSEGMMLGVKAGVDPKKLLDVISTSSGNSNAVTKISRKVFTGNYKAEFALDLAHKDLRLALQLGDEQGVPLMFGGLLVNLMRNARAKGFGTLDSSAMMRLLEEAMQTQIRA